MGGWKTCQWYRGLGTKNNSTGTMPAPARTGRPRWLAPSVDPFRAHAGSVAPENRSVQAVRFQEGESAVQHRIRTRRDVRLRWRHFDVGLHANTDELRAVGKAVPLRADADVGAIEAKRH